MDERRPYGVAQQSATPVFKSASSELATTEGEVSDVPSAFVADERREAGVYQLHSQRTGRSLAAKLVWPGVLFLWSLGWGTLVTRLVIEGKIAEAFWVTILVLAPVIPLLWAATRVAFDNARVTMNAERVEVEAEALTLFDIGARSVPVAEIFAFAVQPFGSKSRVVVLTRDGEAKLLRCNVLDRAHAIFVVTRLNRELASHRAGHYRKG